jgi:hypothetical protein
MNFLVGTRNFKEKSRENMKKKKKA